MMKSFVFCILQFLIVSAFSEDLPKYSWKIVATDSQEKNEYNPGCGPASCLIDNNLKSFWITEYRTRYKSLPHFVVIDLGGFADLSGITFYPRLNAAGQKISKYRIYVANDLQHWKLMNDGTFKWKRPFDNDPQNVAFPSSVNARYIKFDILKLVDWQKHDICDLAEIDVQGVYTTPFFQPRIGVKNKEVVKGRIAEFVDSSIVQSTEIRSLEWHFPGGEPSVSFERNPKVRYNRYGKYSASLSITSKEGKRKSITVRNIVSYLPAPEIARKNWKVSVSDQEIWAGDSAANMFDNLPRTHWHTSWCQGVKLPHTILIDLGKEKIIHGIGYLPRQIGSFNGTFSSYKIFVSNDSANFKNEVAHVSESKPYRSFRYVEFPASKGRYVKIVIDKSFPFGKNFASASEIYVYGEDEHVPFVSILVVLFLISLLVTLFYYLYKKRQSIIVPTNPLIQKPSDNVNQIKISIFLFGTFQIVNENKKVDGFFNKIKQIFVLITYHTIENSGISTAEIGRILWPGLSGEKVASARSSNIKKLRTVIEDYPDIQIIIENKTWILKTTDRVFIDFQSYRDLYLLLAKAIESKYYNESDIDNFLTIVERGRFISDFETDWADELKNKISEEITALLKEILIHFNDYLPRKIINRICDCLFLQDDLNTDALQLKLRMFVEDSNLGLAKNFYETFSRKYQSIYKEDFGVSFAEMIDDKQSV